MPSDKGKRLVLDQAFFESIVACCPDAIIGINRQGVVTLFNDAAEALTGWPIKEVLHKMHVTELYAPPELARQVKKLMYHPGHGGAGNVKNLEVSLKTREGQTIPILLSAMVLQKKGKEIGSIGFFHDLTRTKQLEEISISDNLTGLYNRRHFHSVLATELERSLRYNRPLTLVYLDLDHFKPFNDTFGHAQGDDILRLVAGCTKLMLRVQDYAFRIGGDEFALLLIETDLKSGWLVADRFRSAFNRRWSQIMDEKGSNLKSVSLSLGVAQFHMEDDGERGENADNFVKRADMAMYEAKRAGGDKAVKAKAFIGK
jgi:diguanylate cyclase (GGDEF)-like protein/PAS domain S-box-containing protein